MSLLKYFSRESEIDQSTVSGDPGIQDDDGNNSESDASGSELTERERSLEDDIVSEPRFPQVTGAVSIIMQCPPLQLPSKIANVSNHAHLIMSAAET